ncbi:MAG TPA: TonB-dependent receptor [Bacteroidales bacterium]|jgi:outer membrane receptor protein involved in Fe transport|nr:TonB-dependent receptor [Bacteroidales bacterium]HQN23610.1 TonB-dependent receptor [Bacteroidales bacterium]
MTNKLKFIVILTFLVFTHLVSHGQTSCTVSGTVVDNNNLPVQYASVVAYESGKLLTGTLTGENGDFSFKINRSADEHLLVIEFIGYAKTEVRFKPERSSINLDKIIIKEDAVLLGEAVVTAKMDAAKSSVEHTVIHASANISFETGTALDILRTSSSVTLVGDAISIRGNRNILVLLDGVPTTVGDLAVIPAANIKNIEIITSPDASYDSEGTGGIINIVSKRSVVKGFSGVISANYGFNHFVTGNLGLSYTKPKTSWRFNYNTKYEDDIVNTTLNRLIHENGNQTYQQMKATRYVYNNNLGVGTDLRINEKNILSIDLKSMLPRHNIKQDLDNKYIKAGIESKEKRRKDVTWNRENIEGNISYRHIIKPDTADLTISGSISRTWGHRPSYYFLEGAEIGRSDSGGSPFITSFQADFKQKISSGTLSAGAKLTYRDNHIYHRFYSNENGEWNYSETFSNDLHHTELVNAAYILLSSRKGKFTYKAGLRGEFSTVTLESNREKLKERNNDLFIAPSLSGTYNLTKNQEIAFAFTRRIGRPIYPQLNPYMSMVDASTFEQGNMNLRPEKSSKLDLSYTLKSRFVQLFTDAYLNYTTGYISQITKISDGLLITTYINGTSDLKSGAEITLKLLPSTWMTATLSANTFYVDTRGNFAGAEINNKGWSNNSNLLLDFMIGKSTDLQIQYFLTTPQYFPQLTTSLTHHMNVGLKHTFLKGAMSVSLLLTDAFNTYKWQVQSSNNIFDLTNISTMKSRMLWVGLSYNFNSFKQKSGETKSEGDRTLIKL